MIRRLDEHGEPVRGERRINEAQAEIVRRIFREYASGKSPRSIAWDLNKEGIMGPGDTPWSDTAIRGRLALRSGIIHNELYVGVLLWNRQRHVKNPSTGKSVGRLNPESEWIRTPVPDLRIVSDELWQAVRERHTKLVKTFGASISASISARAKKLNQLRRPSFLLSGLLKCGVCGANYIILTDDYYGCSNHFRKDTCSNKRMVRRDDMERRALTGLSERLVSAERVRMAVAAYAEQVNGQNRAARAQAEAARRDLAKTERGIASIIAAIEDGMYQPSMKARMDELERQKAELLERIDAAPADMPDIHPNVAEIYRRKVERFSNVMDDPALRTEATDDIRSLIGEIVIVPGEKRRQFTATLRGELMGILDFVGGKPTSPTGNQLIPKAVGCSPASRSISAIPAQRGARVSKA